MRRTLPLNNSRKEIELVGTEADWFEELLAGSLGCFHQMVSIFS